jgi:crossover junction endodeoxyribonuclease RusA
MTELLLEIPKAQWHTSNDRGHWRKFSDRKRWIRKASRLAAGDLPKFDQAHVCALVGYPRAGRADPSNASPVVKAMLDGLTDAGVWTDDDSEHVVAVEYRRDVATGKPGVHTVRLVLTRPVRAVA